MRGGASRRRLVLGVLLAVSVALLVLDSREGNDPVTSGARAAGDMAFHPISAGVSAVAAPIDDSYRALRAAPAASERIDELERENKKLRSRLEARDRDDEQAGELDELLRLSGMGGYEIVPAHTVTRMSSSGEAEVVTLDVGKRDGVRADMTVVNGDGLVGRVSRAQAHTSTVMLVTDGSSAVGARMEDSSEIGAIDGQARAVDGSGALTFTLMDTKARMHEGDRIVTLGSHENRPYVPGVPIGTIAEVEETSDALQRTARVAPAADLSTLDVVGVVVAGPEEDPRDSVLPPDPRDEDEADAARHPTGETGGGEH
ncbi:rod shape-determining protein MreC [Haloactinospora alba]|uniref:Cell shape-determining protein MreC n=1 Tax=Haloactinospora alba TaxID=405555 RepID=A0A543NKG5_9ACTN|nr:rod shape-determining protein MreC [Haloactinospora alba]TQN32355.1 rod shape-determining protein MreC [Haloactinospora alba]